LGEYDVFEAYKRYADFQGRAGRSEYWMFVLFFFLVAMGAGVINGILTGVTGSEAAGAPLFIVMGLFYLGSLVPSLAVGFRRLHDTNRSAWWLLIAFLPLIGSIVLIVFYCLPGTPGPNRFGPAPGASAEELKETFA
jgi:uncharacterized membrane protein YhaH (DUF805 family)